MSSALHVVFGAGQVGSRLARELLDAGHRVRVVRRSETAVGEGIEVVSADALDPEQAVAAAAGADVVYHCMNPSAYTGAAWADEFPRQGEAVIRAALDNGARLVCLDNLYGYGVVEGARTEDTPLGATGAKGKVRVAWDRTLREAATERGLRFVVGRAGDFFGPGTGDHSLMSGAQFAGLAHGRRFNLVGRPDQIHAFSYVPDVVSGLAALGAAERDVEGRIFLLPVVEVAPAELVAAVGAALGVRVRTMTVPPWALRALAPVVPLFRELGETLYQWDRPFRVDDQAFRGRFPGIGTDLAGAVRGIMSELQDRAERAA